jgi:hypothetical protein
MTTSNENLQNDRVDLESKVLAAAFKQSIDLGDSAGADFAHKQLFQLLRANRTTEYLMPRPKPALAEIPDLGESSEISSTVEDSPPEEPAAQVEQFEQFEPPIDVRAEEPEQQADAPVSSQDEAVLDLARLFAADALAEEPSNGGNGVQIQHFDPSTASSVPKQPVGKANKPKPTPVGERKTEEMHLPVALTPEVEALIQDVATAKDIYGMLGLSQYASYEQIHKSFLKRARRLLLCKTRAGYARSLLEQLRNLWIAHDILVDPKTRNDYDFGVLGLKSSSGLASQSKPTRSPTRQSKIGELFEASGLLEPTELQIACDMHKAMPEMQFGRFLVKQGFLEEVQLQAVLAAQRLIRTGKLTLSQFKEAMFVVNNHTGTFSQVLLEKGFCSKEDLTLIERIEAETARKKPQDSPMGRDIAASSLAKISIGSDEEDKDHALPPPPKARPHVRQVTPAKGTPISPKAAGRSLQRPTDKIRNEIKITHQRLHSMIEDYEMRTNTPIVIRPKSTDGSTTYAEIDQIDASEIEPHHESDGSSETDE